MTASSSDDWSLMLPFDPTARCDRAGRPACSVSMLAPQSATRSPTAVLDGLRDRLEVVVLGRAPVAPVRRFYRDGRLDGYMQITRTRAR